MREVLQEKIDTLFDTFDVIAAAGQPVTATTLDTNLETDLSFADPLGGIGNLCGLPAIGVPCGFSAAGMPMGIQFLARVRNDAAVVAAARLFQQHYGLAHAAPSDLRLAPSRRILGAKAPRLAVNLLSSWL